MQSVKWTYYGDDSTYKMQKQHMEQNLQQITGCTNQWGVQLGLTKSLRCTLPEGTDGTGYWTITISALGV